MLYFILSSCEACCIDVRFIDHFRQIVENNQAMPTDDDSQTELCNGKEKEKTVCLLWQ